MLQSISTPGTRLLSVPSSDQNPEAAFSCLKYAVKVGGYVNMRMNLGRL